MKASKHYTNSNHFINGNFINIDKKNRYKLTSRKVITGLWAYIFQRSKHTKPINSKIIPVVKHDKKSLIFLKNYSVLRIAHSTLFFKINRKYWLTDPIFSNHVSPVSWLSNKRFHNLPIKIDELPEIEGVIISHNHYDHLDAASIILLNPKVKYFFVPLGLKKSLIKLGVYIKKIVELDWWESTNCGEIQLIVTPAQHFSGRGIFDRNKTLWCSWIIHSPRAKLYFSGDSGYFNGFKEIGEKYGPFDMTFIEIGGYNDSWKEIHMMPNESVQAHIDLNGKIMFPIHNSSFKLAMHSWHEPLTNITFAANKMNVDLTCPKMGEAIPILKYTKTEKWWVKE